MWFSLISNSNKKSLHYGGSFLLYFRPHIQKKPCKQYLQGFRDYLTSKHGYLNHFFL